MSIDDREQLEYIENWKKKKQEKMQEKENKKVNIKIHFTRCKEYFKLGFTCLFACVKEILKR